jgi:hypothetical protein
MRNYTLTTMVSMVGVILLYACFSSEAYSSSNSTSNPSMTEAAISIAKEGLLSFSKVASASIDGISSATSLGNPQKICTIASMQKHLEIAALLKKENMCTQSS